MRILVLSKRQYTGRDLLDDQFGRLFHIPAGLTRLGHEVTGIALSYRPRREGWYRWEKYPGLAWLSINLRRFLPSAFVNYLREIDRLIQEVHPDFVWACSDAFHVILAWNLCSRHHIPLVVDLYDNFESFSATKVLGVTALFRKACRFADGLTLVSNALTHYVLNTYGITSPHLLLRNGVDTKVFFPHDQAMAREILGLPCNVQLIGTAGAISSNRGITDLFDAFLRLADENEGIWLVLAGPRDKILKRYSHNRIIDLGMLPHAKVPLLFSALDVAVVCNRDSAFGRYCFPQKLYEILACRTPVVAAEVGDTADVLAANPQCLYHPGSSISLMERIREQLSHPSSCSSEPLPTWDTLANRFDSFLCKLNTSLSVRR